MRPEGVRARRKDRRAAMKGVGRGRRATHQVKTEEPRPNSTWMRRHPGELPPYILRRLGSAA